MHKPALISAALASAAMASTAASSHNGSFTLRTKLRHHHGNPNFEGLEVGALFEGAVHSSLVGNPLDEGGEVFNLTNGYINSIVYAAEVGENLPFSVALDDAPPDNNTTPAGYNSASFNYGNNTQGFFFDRKGYVNIKSQSFQTFAVCNVSYILPYNIFGPQMQVVWSTIFHKDTKDGQCADVHLYPVF